MSAATHLAQYGVTVDQAREFILANLGNLQHIIDVCGEFGVTNQMLAEIYGGVTATDVINFFQANGFNSTHLDTGVANSIVGTWFAQDLSQGVGTQQLRFNEDGTYRSIDTVSIPMEGEVSGSETGTYTWDQHTGALTLNVISDDNGSLGLNKDGNYASIVDGQLSLVDGNESFLYTQVAAGEKQFNYEALIGSSLYNIYRENGGWQSATFKFTDIANGVAAEGITETPNQYTFTYFIDANGFLHMELAGDGVHNVIGITAHNSEPSTYDQLIWSDYDLTGDQDAEAALYVENVQNVLDNQSGGNATEQEYFFYDMNAANLFIA